MREAPRAASFCLSARASSGFPLMKEIEEGEILLLDDAELLDVDACKIMEESFRSYADALCAVLREAAVICEGLNL